MKKVELESKIAELESQLKSVKDNYSNNINTLKSAHAVEKQSLENKMYNDWVALNGKFLKRYIRENVLSNLRTETEADWGGYITVKLYYNNELLSSDNTSIITGRNPLES